MKLIEKQPIENRVPEGKARVLKNGPKGGEVCARLGMKIFNQLSFWGHFCQTTRNHFDQLCCDLSQFDQSTLTFFSDKKYCIKISKYLTL